MTISFISHPDCALHDTGAYHPESAARLAAISDQLICAGLEPVLHHYDAPLASREQLYLAHDKKYVDGLFSSLEIASKVWLDADTMMSKASLQAALRAAGAAVLGVDQVMTGLSPAAFCSIRPPGHHAEHAQTMGFCLFNNVAVGAAYALAEYGLERVAIVDFDVHHGNGTENIFADEPRVMFCSSFQHPFYPHETNIESSAHIIKVPLAAGTDGSLFRQQIVSHWLPKLDEFKPQLLLISAGFDGHKEDDIASLCLVENDFGWVTEQIRQIADSYAEGRIVSVLEGGYALSALGRSVAVHIKALL